MVFFFTIEGSLRDVVESYRMAMILEVLFFVCGRGEGNYVGFREGEKGWRLGDIRLLGLEG